MDYYACMRAFTRVVELGSFSKVAAEDGVKVSTISRYVSALESDLGAALFNRSTRRLHLTEVGSGFYEKVVRILADIEDARLQAGILNTRPQGLLRINVPGSFGRRHIAPHLHEFLATYPEIRIDVTLTDETVDLIASGADLAIRIGVLADSTLKAKKLASNHRILVASPSYLASVPPIAEPQNLREQECLLFAFQPKDTWYFRHRVVADGKLIETPIHGRLRINDSDALLEAALAGLGVATLPTWLVADDVSAGRLIRVLPAWEALIAPDLDRAIWAVYPPKKIVPPKVTAFTGFLEQRFGKPPYWERVGREPEQGG